MKSVPAPSAEAIPVDGEVRIACIALFILLGAVEGPLLFWGLYSAASATVGMEKPDRLLAFLWRASLILVPVAIVNAALGAYVARRVSEPLGRIRRALQEIARGNLEHEVAAGGDGLFAPYTAECRETLASLRRLIYRDGQFAREAHELLGRCSRQAKDAELKGLIDQARSRLSIVNEHFMKGKRENA